MVSGHDQRGAARHGVHHQRERAGAVGAAVGDVAHEDRPALRRRRHLVVRPVRLGRCLDAVAELAEQRLELGAAPVHVADDVERAVLVADVAVELEMASRKGTPTAT